MSWFNTDGKMSENILFSKVTYTRNISGLPFPAKNNDALNDIISRADALLKKNGFHTAELSQKNKSASISYYEKQYVDMAFCNFSHSKALFFNDPCSLCVSVGGANLINISAILAGASVMDAYKISSSAEELLDSEFDFAYSEKHGYLSSMPHLCGSGMRISCALYLPAIAQSNKLSEIKNRLADEGISIYPLFSCLDNGDIYVMTHLPCKNTDEAVSVEMFERAMLDIVRCERGECSFQGEDKISHMIDTANMSIGALAYAGSLSEEQLISISSSIRKCLSFNAEEKLCLSISPASLNTLLFENLSSGIITNSRTQISSPEFLNIERAMQVKRLVLSFPEKTSLART